MAEVCRTVRQIRGLLYGAANLGASLLIPRNKPLGTPLLQREVNPGLRTVPQTP